MPWLAPRHHFGHVWCDEVYWLHWDFFLNYNYLVQASSLVGYNLLQLKSVQQQFIVKKWTRLVLRRALSFPVRTKLFTLSRNTVLLWKRLYIHISFYCKLYCWRSMMHSDSKPILYYWLCEEREKLSPKIT